MSTSAVDVAYPLHVFVLACALYLSENKNQDFDDDKVQGNKGNNMSPTSLADFVPS